MAPSNGGSQRERHPTPGRSHPVHAMRLHHSSDSQPRRISSQPARMAASSRTSPAPKKRASTARVLPRHAPVGVQLGRPLGREALRKQRRIRLYGRIAAVVAVLVAVIGGISYFTHVDRFEVHTVNVTGAHMLTASAVSAVVETQLQGNIAGVFSRRSTFLYPQSAIESNLTETFPVLKSSRVETQGITGNELVVSVEERTPFALWCSGGELGGDTLGLSTACYVMDETGFVFASAFQANALGKGLLIYRGGIATSSDPIGSTLLPGDFHAVAIAVEAMRGVVPNPSELLIEGESLSLRYNNGFTIRFTTTRAAEKDALIANLRAALESDALAGVPHENIEYVDLRFENRLYYKLRANTVPPS